MLMVKNGKIIFQTYIRNIKNLNQINDNLFENKEKVNSPFTVNELKVIIKNLKMGKASGYDNILNEFQTFMPE